ncbi:hypothetical protein GOODEAATRI_013535 [Goodea atripinnis]|uniref:Uncharacterized protein n=1 Tax=Goodea atripinnis TaxID=208336 RepID=A0ABV0NAG4_9TELE
MFLFKKSNFCTVEGLKRFLFSETISPALENTLSQGTEEAGVTRNCLAGCFRFGYRERLGVLHYEVHKSFNSCGSSLSQQAAVALQNAVLSVVLVSLVSSLRPRQLVSDSQNRKCWRYSRPIKSIVYKSVLVSIRSPLILSSPPQTIGRGPLRNTLILRP